MNMNVQESSIMQVYSGFPNRRWRGCTHLVGGANRRRRGVGVQSHRRVAVSKKCVQGHSSSHIIVVKG